MSTIRKALLAGFFAALAALLSYNIPGWVDGSSDFNWRSVVAGVIGAFISAVVVYVVPNKAPSA